MSSIEDVIASESFQDFYVDDVNEAERAPTRALLSKVLGLCNRLKEYFICDNLFHVFLYFNFPGSKKENARAEMFHFVLSRTYPFKFWLETAKTSRLLLDKGINYLIAIIKTCNIYVMVW